MLAILYTRYSFSRKYSVLFCFVYVFCVVGIIIYELYSRQDPYKGENLKTVLRKVCDPRKNHRPTIPPSAPPKLVTLMKRYYMFCVSAGWNTRPLWPLCSSRIKVFGARIRSLDPMRRNWILSSWIWTCRKPSHWKKNNKAWSIRLPREWQKRYFTSWSQNI